MASRGAIWVPAVAGEDGLPPAVLEALWDARELGDRLGRPVTALVLGRVLPDPLLAPLGGHGADLVLALEHPSLGSPTGEAEVEALLAVAAAGAPGPVLVAETAEGRLLGPRLAVRLGRPFVGDAVACRPAPDGGLEVTCPRYEDRAYVGWRLAGEPGAVIGLRPGTAGVGLPRPGRVAPVTREVPPLERFEPRARSLGRTRGDPATLDLREADRIVAVGRGAGGPDGVALAARLADVLGASLGASRVAVDLGWVPYERQVGQTGRTVTPSLYVAVGISGASQHVEGMKGAQVVVALNTDKTAPIFRLATLGLVGDARAIVSAALDRWRRAPSAARTGSG